MEKYELHYTVQNGEDIAIVYESKSKKMVGYSYSVKRCGIDIETNIFDEGNKLEILEFLLKSLNPKYILKESIKNDELQVYKKLGYDLHSNIILV